MKKNDRTKFETWVGKTFQKQELNVNPSNGKETREGSRKKGKR